MGQLEVISILTFVRTSNIANLHIRKMNYQDSLIWYQMLIIKYLVSVLSRLVINSSTDSKSVQAEYVPAPQTFVPDSFCSSDDAIFSLSLLVNPPFAQSRSRTIYQDPPEEEKMVERQSFKNML